MSAFSLIELLVVVSILSIVVAVATPSWQSVRVASAEREARIVLERLNLKQRQFWQQHSRYAMADELPPLAVLSETVGRYYQLSAESTDAEFLLRLISTLPAVPSLSLDHRGVWTTTDSSMR
jgi:prepilin-type N-terminal cleavage/methylation domain-containing protein